MNAAARTSGLGSNTTAVERQETTTTTTVTDLGTPAVDEPGRVF